MGVVGVVEEEAAVVAVVVTTGGTSYCWPFRAEKRRPLLFASILMIILKREKL